MKLRIAVVAACALNTDLSLAKDAETGNGLDEIVVTAQKREERLQDVPVPVTALEATALASQGQTRLQDYFTSVPGLSFTGGGAGTVGGTSTLSLRGMVTGGITGPTVGLMIDDVPYGASSGAGLGAAQNPDIDPSDLARVEVLRGPQGTLYGASSIGGLIKFVTVDPSTEALSGHVQLLGNTVDGGNSGYAVRGAINIPLSDQFALRASAMRRRDPGYVKNVLTGEQDVNTVDGTGGRLSALWRITPELTVKLSALAQKLDGQGDQVVDINTPSLQPTYGDLTQSRLSGTGSYTLRSQLYSATVNARVAGFDLTSISGYSINDYANVQDRSRTYGGLTERFFAVAGGGLGNFLGTHKFSQELRANTNTGRYLDGLLGVFYTHESVSTDQTVPALDPTGRTVGLIADFNYPTIFSEYALFADLTIHFTERFDVQIGGRQSHNRQTYNETDSGPIIPFTINLPSPVVYPTERTSESAFTYLLTPRFRISEHLMSYARFASGYRPGGPNFTALPFNLPLHYSPDKSNSYELGVKGDLFERMFTFETSVYYVDWKDLQLSLQDAASGFGFFGNGGSAKSQGAELSIQARPLRGLTLSLVSALNDAQLKRDLPPASSVYAVKGDPLPYSARFSGSFSADQDVSITSTLTAFIGATVSYNGERRGAFATTPNAYRFIYPAYTQVDARVGARYDSWILTVFGSNLANRRGILGDTPLGGNTSGIYYIQPRTVGLSLSKDF
jgi:outer membrane receptor protein involved in Fe transport